MNDDNRFNIKFYFNTLTSLLSKPGAFFSSMPENIELQSWKFLLVSSLFFTGASLINETPSKPILWGAIFLMNSLGMIFISAGIGYYIMTLLIGKPVSFKKLSTIYAFSAGVTLISSWIPVMAVLTEPWKWWLIWLGMTKGFGFKKSKAAIIVGVSVLIIIALFKSILLPLIASYKNG